MSISGINNNDGSYSDSIGGAQMGKEAFMKLLVQQLKNQDPMSPMDNDKFIAQLTQLSSLEGIQNLNDNMVGLAEDLAALRPPRFAGESTPSYLLHGLPVFRRIAALSD